MKLNIHTWKAFHWSGIYFHRNTRWLVSGFCKAQTHAHNYRVLFLWLQRGILFLSGLCSKSRYVLSGSQVGSCKLECLTLETVIQALTCFRIYILVSRDLPASCYYSLARLYSTLQRHYIFLKAKDKLKKVHSNLPHTWGKFSCP